MWSFSSIRAGARWILGTLAILLFAQTAQLLEAADKPAKKKPGKEGKAKAAKPSQPAEDLFTNTQILRIQIDIPEEGMRTLRELRWGGWGGGEQKRPSVKATVREGGVEYKDVAVHLKGAAGSFRGVDDHPCLTLNFDKYVKGQTFHGIQRFSLNNSVQDRSLLNEQISREMFAKAGVPVPRATHAKVELNGRDLGLEVLVEAANKQFLARHFKNPNGNLYDGGFLRDITDELEKSSGPNPQDRDDLTRLAEAARDPNYTNRMARLEKLLDMDEFLSYLAVDVITCDWDGYAINRNNYRIYHDPDSDKIVFIPHGLDQMFGVMRARTDMPIFPRMSGLVAKAVLQMPEGRQRYRQRLSQLVTNVFDLESITNRLWQVQAQLHSVLAERGQGAARFQESEASAFAQRIVARWASLGQQLTAPDQALQFDASGQARFAQWRFRSDYGKAVLDETADDGGKKLLHVSARNGSCVGVWFTKVRLNPGRYRLEGRMKTQGVGTDPGDRRGGAGLRITGQRFAQKLTGDNGWTDLAFDFEIQDSQQGDFGFMAPIESGTPDVELLCELRAAKGEAWFDRDSLRLVRR